MNYINLNGKILPAAEAHIPVDNGAFRYGRGLFETMLVGKGVIALEDYHWERLQAGMRQLYLELPALHHAQWLGQQVIATVKKNGLEKLCRVRLQVYAGGGGLYGADSSKAGVVIECFPVDEALLLLNENGLVAGLATGLAKAIDTTSNMKTASALIYAMAAAQAKENKWNDALISNTNGHIVESTIANLFWIKDGIIYTPPLSDGCVAGVMRRHVMERVTVTEQTLSAEALAAADEVFLTNAIRRIKWIKNIGDQAYSNVHTRKLYFSIWQQQNY